MKVSRSTETSAVQERTYPAYSLMNPGESAVNQTLNDPGICTRERVVAAEDAGEIDGFVLVAKVGDGFPGYGFELQWGRHVSAFLARQ